MGTGLIMFDYSKGLGTSQAENFILVEFRTDQLCFKETKLASKTDHLTEAPKRDYLTEVYQIDHLV